MQVMSSGRKTTERELIVPYATFLAPLASDAELTVPKANTSRCQVQFGHARRRGEE